MLAIDVVRALFGAALLAWLPGYAWSHVLLPRLAPLERFVVAVALSVALVTLYLYGGNVLFGLRISAAGGVWGALLLTAAAAAVPLARILRRRLEARLS